MRISKPSIASMAAIATLGMGNTALAQNVQPEIPSSAGPQSASGTGHGALDQLAEAIARGKNETARPPDPVVPRTDNPEGRRRAFEAFRKRLPSPDMDARARAAQQLGEANLAAERARQAKALRQALGLEPAEERALAKAAPAVLTKGWVPVLFVSSSMPLPILRSYAIQLERVKGVLAFRGVPGGLRKMGPMAKLTAQILRIDPGCEGPNCAMRDVQLIVDPIAFRQHGISQVPALAMIPGDPTQAYCERDEESLRAGHLVSGDSALSGMLDEYARLGGTEEVRDAQALARSR